MLVLTVADAVDVLHRPESSVEPGSCSFLPEREAPEIAGAFLLPRIESPPCNNLNSTSLSSCISQIIYRNSAKSITYVSREYVSAFRAAIATEDTQATPVPLRCKALRAPC